MTEKIVEQRKAVEKLEKDLGEEKKKLSTLIAEHQKSCPHKNKKEVFVRMEGRVDKLEVLKGYECKDCDLFIPSKVYRSPISNLSKYCRICDGDVEYLGRSGFSCSGDREDWYKCKVCGREQSEFIG